MNGEGTSRISVFPIFRHAWLALTAFPIHFFVLQIPAATAEPLIVWGSSAGLDKAIIPALGFALYGFFVSAFSAGLTLSSVLQQEQGGVPLFSISYGNVSERMGVLALSSLLVGLVIGLGLYAFILVGLFFMGLYLFVPQIIIYEKEQRAMAVLAKSAKLAKKRLGLVLSVVAFLVLVTLTAELLGETLGTWLAGVSNIPALRLVILSVFKAGLAIVIGAYLDLWLSFYFLATYRTTNP
ncbi:MAG: hypothetical protein HY537_03870 [Deltaproteobacteria bacterium]|nr:hypothetical protein [Deltaproteobacteria bacterium]